MKNILKYIVNVLRGDFSAELSDTPLSRTESDNVIELVLNKDKKRPGAMTGFLLNKGAVKSWGVNTSYGAVLRSVFHKYLHYTLKSHA